MTSISEAGIERCKNNGWHAFGKCGHDEFSEMGFGQRREMHQ